MAVWHKMAADGPKIDTLAYNSESISPKRHTSMRYTQGLSNFSKYKIATGTHNCCGSMIGSGGEHHAFLDILIIFLL